jgi:hypothetical protein
LANDIVISVVTLARVEKNATNHCKDMSEHGWGGYVVLFQKGRGIVFFKGVHEKRICLQLLMPGKSETSF